MSEIRIPAKDLGKQLRKDLRKLTRGVKQAAKKTARQSVKICQSLVPEEFIEIAAAISVVQGGLTVRSHAPHSAAVEVGASGFSVGSRTFGGNLPDPRAMEEYIRKHGSGRGRVGKSIRKGLRGLVQKARRGKNGSGRASPIDAPRQLAFAVLNGLKKRRKPHRFMAAALPQIYERLDANMAAAADKASSGGGGGGGEEGGGKGEGAAPAPAPAETSESSGG